MLLRSQIAYQIGRLTAWTLTNFTNGGSSLPGQIAKSIDPNILENLSQYYDVAIVTGTNGKTLTTSLATRAIKKKYAHVITNDSGSNMVQGIISTFLNAPQPSKDKRGIAILEVDEGSLKNIVPYVHPKVFVHTNLFEDQLDRYGSLEAVYNKLIEAANMAPEATIITNADCPILQSKDTRNPKIYFGFNRNYTSPEIQKDNSGISTCPSCDSPLSYHMRTYGDLGDYFCETSFFKRPELNHEINSIESLDLDRSEFIIDHHHFELPIAGIYNIYNALSAYSLAQFFDVSYEDINQAFKMTERVFGRQEKFQIQDQKVLMNLVKNPVGFDQVTKIISLDSEPFALYALFNNNYADGTDPSWIYDADFEIFKDMNVDNIYVAGSVKEDLANRFLKAGFSSENIHVLDSLEEALSSIETTTTHNIHILASYTATLAFRKLLKDKKYI